MKGNGIWILWQSLRHSYSYKAATNENTKLFIQVKLQKKAQRVFVFDDMLSIICMILCNVIYI